MIAVRAGRTVAHGAQPREGSLDHAARVRCPCAAGLHPARGVRGHAAGTGLVDPSRGPSPRATVRPPRAAIMNAPGLTGSGARLLEEFLGACGIEDAAGAEPGEVA